jgi:hypothetical protein
MTIVFFNEAKQLFSGKLPLHAYDDGFYPVMAGKEGGSRLGAENAVWFSCMMGKNDHRVYYLTFVQRIQFKRQERRKALLLAAPKGIFLKIYFTGGGTYAILLPVPR